MLESGSWTKKLESVGTDWNDTIKTEDGNGVFGVRELKLE